MNAAQARRLAAYQARLRKARLAQLTALVVEAARDAGAGDVARYRATVALVEAARAGERVTQRVIADRAACSVRTVGRAIDALKRSALVNVHAPAPHRDRAGRCIGRDPRGSRLFLALQSRAATSLAVAAGLRPPNRPRRAASTKGGLRGPSHPLLPGLPDGKPPLRLGAVRQE